MPISDHYLIQPAVVHT
jgi:hypothetical protein